MSLAKPIGALVLLSAVCLACPPGPARAGPDCLPDLTPPLEPLILRCDNGLPTPPTPEWEPVSYQKLTDKFSVEGLEYRAKERRYLWTLRTRDPYPGALGLAEKKLRDDLEEAFKDIVFAGFFYDAARLKVGSSQMFFLTGDRDDDGRFLVFADLNTANMELVATRILMTQMDRPKLPLVSPPKDKNGDKGPPLP